MQQKVSRLRAEITTIIFPWTIYESCEYFNNKTVSFYLSLARYALREITILRAKASKIQVL